MPARHDLVDHSRSGAVLLAAHRFRIIGPAGRGATRAHPCRSQTTKQKQRAAIKAAASGRPAWCRGAGRTVRSSATRPTRDQTAEPLKAQVVSHDEHLPHCEEPLPGPTVQQPTATFGVRPLTCLKISRMPCSMRRSPITGTQPSSSARWQDRSHLDDGLDDLRGCAAGEGIGASVRLSAALPGGGTGQRCRRSRNQRVTPTSGADAPRHPARRRAPGRARRVLSPGCSGPDPVGDPIIARCGSRAPHPGKRRRDDSRSGPHHGRAWRRRAGADPGPDSAGAARRGVLARPPRQPARTDQHILTMDRRLTAVPTCDDAGWEPPWLHQ
jgi:hypothetical protein